MEYSASKRAGCQALVRYRGCGAPEAPASFVQFLRRGLPRCATSLRSFRKLCARLACTKRSTVVQRMHQCVSSVPIERCGSSLEMGATFALTADSATWPGIGMSPAPPSVTMTNVIDNLMALQELQFTSPKSAPNRAEQMEALRSEIPESLLRIYDRFIARKR